MALETTPGHASADSYASLAEADGYCVIRLHDTWDDSEDPEQENLLRWARILLDAFPRAWTGAIASDTQALSWPRTGMADQDGRVIPSSGAASIPTRLKYAQAELAWQLKNTDRTADNALVNLGLTALKAGPVQFNFGNLSPTDNSVETPRYIREVTALMAVLPDAVKYLLVPSWLKADPEKRRPALVETL